MTRRRVLRGIGVGTLLLTGAGWAAPYGTPTQNDAIWRAKWHDADRNRDVPVKIYYPTDKGPFPVIVFSHGLGGTCENYEYLGDYWAKHGFVSVHVQHVKSDDSVWRGGGGMEALRAAITLQEAFARPHDVSFAIDQLEVLNKSATWPLHGKLDLTRIGMAGHSFGANTTLLVSGLSSNGQSVGDPRVKCSIAMSSPAPRQQDYSIFDGIKIPMLHMTGTNDVSPVDLIGMKAIDRRIPYDHINAADGYLITFAGGDHMLFSGRPRLRGGPIASDDRNHELILESSTAFWDAYLKGDTQALQWLRTNFSKELGANGVFEQKVGKR